MMSKAEQTPDGPGIQLGRSRKRRLWMLVLVAAAAGVAIDVALVPMVRGGSAGGPPLPPVAAATAAVLMVALLYGGTWLYLRLADELERQDNLIAFTIGFLFNIGAFIFWNFLALGGLAPPPEAYALFLSTAAVGALAYGLLKLQRMG